MSRTPMLITLAAVLTGCDHRFPSGDTTWRATYSTYYPSTVDCWDASAHLEMWDDGMTTTRNGEATVLEGWDPFGVTRVQLTESQPEGFSDTTGRDVYFADDTPVAVDLDDRLDVTFEVEPTDEVSDWTYWHAELNSLSVSFLLHVECADDSGCDDLLGAELLGYVTPEFPPLEFPCAYRWFGSFEPE